MIRGDLIGEPHYVVGTTEALRPFFLAPPSASEWRFVTRDVRQAIKYATQKQADDQVDFLNEVRQSEDEWINFDNDVRVPNPGMFAPFVITTSIERC